MKNGQDQNSRRIFLKQFIAAGGLATLSANAYAGMMDDAVDFDIAKSNGEIITIDNNTDMAYFSPLDQIDISLEKKYSIDVLDGKGNKYHESESSDKHSFIIGGALGNHLILVKNKRGIIVDIASLKVDARTGIKDKSNTYGQLLDNLYYSMIGQWGKESFVARYEGKFYHFFVRWIRDHVHTLKGMKYFYPELNSGIDLYADSQREDGMIWDNYNRVEGLKSYWEQRFSYGDFYRKTSDGEYEFRRIPVENDVEYLFVEGIYYTWKATGDDKWMSGLTGKAKKALEYSITDPYRWSEKYQLLKRGFTIDTWDFQPMEDADISTGEGNPPDQMIIKRGKTRFGIMFGDNTGYAASCRYLAEMLEYTGKADEARKYRKRADDIMERLNHLTWLDDHYLHHLPEDTNIDRDLGVNQREQVSLSNAYSLNRGIGKEKVSAIIRKYQEIKAELPESSPGEWYTIYPPFEKGFEVNSDKWEYMNGGVTTIVAGELARGAFENGHEKYGLDIIDRISALANENSGFLESVYRGSISERPPTKFTPVSLKNVANTDFSGNTIHKNAMPWIGQGDNDLSTFPVGNQFFKDVRFEVLSPDENGGKAVLGLSGDKGYTTTAKVNINQQAKSIYLLHCATKNIVGNICFVYSDGTRHYDYMDKSKIANWWYPSPPADHKHVPKATIAWTGKNKHSELIGVYACGINNPNPGKTIKHIEFEGPKNNSKWMVIGLTLSDQKAYFKPDKVSKGIPDNWGAAAVVYSLVEGLAGVKDDGQAFQKIDITPRWAITGEKESDVTIKYPASGGYVKYIYQDTGISIKLLLTGNAKQKKYGILLPEGKTANKLVLNNHEQEFTTKKSGSLTYVVFESTKDNIDNIEITYT
jgi:hypothetical protein